MARPNFGHIQRLGHNHYRVFWGKGYRPDGTRDRHSATLHCPREEAEIFLAQKVGSPLPHSSTTWGKFWGVYVEPTYEGLAAKTVYEYRRLYSRHLEPYIKDYPVRDTDYEYVDEILSYIKGASEQRAVKALWRKACRIAVRRRILTYCPIDENTPLKPYKPTRKVLLEADEVIPWLEKIKGLKYEPVLLVELGGGLRVEEACALDWEDITAYEGRALVNVDKALLSVGGKVLKDTKNGYSQREVIIGEPFASRLLELKGEGALVPTGAFRVPDKYTSPSTITHNFRQWCKANNVKYVQPKNLRSTYATLHGEAGSPDSLVSGSMGHSDGTTKGKHYQTITRRGLAMIADNMAEYLEAVSRENSPKK